MRGKFCFVRAKNVLAVKKKTDCGNVLMFSRNPCLYASMRIFY